MWRRTSKHVTWEAVSSVPSIKCALHDTSITDLINAVMMIDDGRSTALHASQYLDDCTSTITVYHLCIFVDI